MRLAVMTLKGRGATTTALGLAAHWTADEERPIVVELDPEGGDIAARWLMRPDPGLADVAAAVASSPHAGSEVLAEGVRSIPVGGVAVRVVCAPPGGRAVRKTLPFLTAPGAKILDDPEGTVITDLGRLYAGSPGWPVAATADAVVCVADGTLDQFAHLRARLDELTDLARLGPRVAIAVIERDYTAAQVAEHFLAAGLNVRVLGAAGPLHAATAAGSAGRAARRGRRAWRQLAETVREFAAEPRPLALAAAPAQAPEQATS